MHCLQTLLYSQPLLQYSVMSVMQKVFCTTRSLAISAKVFAAAFECLLVRRNEEKKRKKKKNILRTPNCDHATITTIITTITTTIQILQGLFCICECRLSATFVKYSIVSISLYFDHGKSKTLVSYLRQTGGYFFSTNTKSLDKGEAAQNKSTF